MCDLVPESHIKMVCDELSNIVPKYNIDEMRFLETFDKLNIEPEKPDGISDITYSSVNNLQLVIFADLVKKSQMEKQIYTH